jgi:choline dehydrogenase-like flavoprotein
MILDFLDPGVGSEHTADVCIVGAGIAGIAVAQQLLATGRSVLLLESGGLAADESSSRLNRGEVVGLPLRVEEGRARVFGGTGTLWPGQCIRLDASDFEVRDWVPGSGWPITADTLEPWYERAEAWLGIPEQASDERAWRRFGLTPPPLDPTLVRHKSAVYSPRPDVGALHRDEFTRAAGVRVLLHATTVGIRVGGNGSDPMSLEIRNADGRTGRVTARTVVLCGGGIENARLLLLSGIGAEHDVVGRYLQDHPTVWADVEAADPAALQAFYGYLGRGRVRYVPRIRLDRQVQRHHQVLNAIATFVYQRRETPGVRAAKALSTALQRRRPPAGLRLADVRGLVGELDGVARAAFRRFVQGRPSAEELARTQVQVLLEQAPHRDSRITLSEERDELGVPRARVDWRLTELERRTARTAVDVLDSELRRLGLGRVVGTDWLDDDDWAKGLEDAYHNIGTTRMSTDPATGVVDADCQVHGVPGLYVCGSSVFPTSGYANPTLTIVALALRLAHHLGSRAPKGAPWT